MDSELNWGLLSTAHINRRLIPAVRGAARAQLLAVASRDLARAQAYAAEWEIPRALGSYQDLLASPDIDVVYIALPNNLHTEWVLRTVQAGKHVLCEKPLALSVEDVDRIEDAARRAGVVVAEAVMHLYHPLNEQVRALVKQGAIGELMTLRGAFSAPLGRPGNYRWNPGMGGGCLWDIGLYPVSWMRWLQGEPESVFGWQTLDTDGVDSGFAGLLRYADGVLGLFDCGFTHQFRVQAEAVGSEAALWLERPYVINQSSKLWLLRGDEQELVASSEKDPYLCEVEALTAAILDGRPLPVPLEFSRRNVATLAALQRSAELGAPVEPASGLDRAPESL